MSRNFAVTPHKTYNAVDTIQVNNDPVPVDGSTEAPNADASGGDWEDYSYPESSLQDDGGTFEDDAFLTESRKMIV